MTTQQSRFSIIEDAESYKPKTLLFDSSIGRQRLTFLDSVDLDDLMNFLIDRSKTAREPAHDND